MFLGVNGFTLDTLTSKVGDTGITKELLEPMLPRTETNTAL